MIERKFITQNMKEFEIKEFIRNELGKVGMSDVKLQNTPLGEKIVITTSRPGLVVGKAGSNISRLTTVLKERFSLQNPQIEIEEVKNPNLVAATVAEMIASTLEHYGSQRFKAIGHKNMSDVMKAGALGVEILLSGRLPSSRAKTWRFYNGYLKKCGDLAITGVDTAYAVGKLKTGVVGVQVRIMPPTTRLPDNIEFTEKPGLEEVKDAPSPKPEKDRHRKGNNERGMGRGGEKKRHDNKESTLSQSSKKRPRKNPGAKRKDAPNKGQKKE